MKKFIRSMFVMTAMMSVVLTSCTKEETTETTSSAPTVLVNDGVAKISASSQVDSIMIDVEASADTNRKIKTLKLK